MIIENGVLVKCEESDIDKNGHFEIPDGVNKIGHGAFRWCENLTSVTIPNGVQDIEEYAFDHCVNLTDITIPQSVVNIGEASFLKCLKLANVNMVDGVQYIGAKAFDSCASLRKISIPNSVQSIGLEAFRNCHSLTNVVISDGITKLDDGVFCGCNSLTKIDIPNSITSIEESAFYGCPLTTITLPASVTSVNYDAFSPDTFVQSITNEGKKLGVYAGIGQVLQDYGEPDAIKTLNCEFVRKTVMKDSEVSPLNVDDKDEYYTLMYNLGLFESKDTMIEKSNKSKEPILNTGYNILRGLFSENNKFGTHLNLDDVGNYFLEMLPVGVNIGFIKFMADKNNLSEVIAQELEQEGFITRTLEWFEIRKNMQELGEAEDDSNFSNTPTSEANRYKVRRYETSESGIDKIKWKTPTVEFLIKEFAESNFMGVTNETRELAEYLGVNSHNLYEQKHFEKAIEINQERIDKKVPDHILSEELKQDKWASFKQYEAKLNTMKRKSLQVAGEILGNQTDISDKIFTYEMLARSDYANFAIGFLTDCCATLYGAGAGAMRAMITDERMQPLAIRDSNNNIIAFGIVYVNKEEGYAVVDDFEVNEKYKGHDEQRQAIYDKAIEGVGAFVNKYNEENTEKPITLVTCGISPNWGGINEFLRQNPRMNTPLKAPNFDDWKYAGSGSWEGDWHEAQYIIWQAGKEQKGSEQVQTKSQEQQESIKQGGENGGQQAINEQGSNGQMAENQLERA